MRRRQMLLGAAGIAGVAPTARAQEGPWPVRQARIIIPFAAGGPQDVPARIIADRLSQRLGATFVVENRPGAGGGLGAQQVARAAPDGATLLFISASITILPTLQPNLNFDPIRDLEPLTTVVDLPAGLMVRNESPFRTLDELLAHARANPGKLTYGSGGVGSANHLTTALFASMAGIELMHVPYRGVSQAVNAVYAGEIDLVFGSSIEVLPHVQQGRARLLGVTTEQRISVMPDVPAIGERVSGYAAPNFFSMYAPKGFPPALRDRLVAELALLRDDPQMKERMAAAAGIIRLDGPGPLAARLPVEIAKWRGLIERANIRPE
ncbi:Bug family tripartite tricarboxylate transporter substrate binding protein [Falsiroseomonas oryzae]|uniref:Bug family tripartite tricarboxylate transporter substrate binding protein n=1 Tax=Falsiroseomonas oryzae TaxID=2766473 RepID=UPI0022EA3426|nr:tripartite tricarboxylate transporter substrate-binding protein [Roseomonas sp. MO-31]